MTQREKNLADLNYIELVFADVIVMGAIVFTFINFTL